jgi:hypothetical protein
MTNGAPEPAQLIIPPARDGHRRSFSEADKRRIVEEVGQPGASLSEVARRYWDSGACAVSVEAGAQAERYTNVRHGADR